MIRFINVYKAYHSTYYVLIDLNFHIKPGDFVFLIGPSGAGKTTLLKLIYREEKPTQGEILVSGFNVKVLPNKKLYLLRRKIGVIFQDFKLISYLNVFENIALMLRILNYPSHFIEQKVSELAQRLDLEEKLDSQVETLSVGEKQRVAIARALIHHPPLLLADEPTSNLDLLRSEKVIELLKEANKEGATVIFATHNESLTESFSQARIMHLEKGILKE
ncbi:MAG: cell division ATP-binding protein FtsE [Candidatus Desulfofervidus auxilii]|nr:cell division ATP-binding protein FtsE [Candidatus Desulfofervidus auxilii]